MLQEPNPYMYLPVPFHLLDSWLKYRNGVTINHFPHSERCHELSDDQFHINV